MLSFILLRNNYIQYHVLALLKNIRSGHYAPVSICIQAKLWACITSCKVCCSILSGDIKRLSMRCQLQHP